MGRIRLAFTLRRAEDPEAEEKFLGPVIETRMRAHLPGGEAEMRGECGITAAAN
jgi:hypothetical protein